MSEKESFCATLFKNEYTQECTHLKYFVGEYLKTFFLDNHIEVEFHNIPFEEYVCYLALFPDILEEVRVRIFKMYNAFLLENVDENNDKYIHCIRFMRLMDSVMEISNLIHQLRSDISMIGTLENYNLHGNVFDAFIRQYITIIRQAF